MGLTFSLEDGSSISLGDLRTFSLEGAGYDRFEELIKEKGTVIGGSIDEGPRGEEPDVVRGPDDNKPQPDPMNPHDVTD